MTSHLAGIFCYDSPFFGVTDAIIHLIWNFFMGLFFPLVG